MQRSKSHPQFVQAVAQRPWLGAQPERLKEAVPKGKERRVIGIRLRLPAGMVHLVHEGRDDDGAQNAIQPGGESNVSVVDLNHGEHRKFVYRQLPKMETD